MNLLFMFALLSIIKNAISTVRPGLDEQFTTSPPNINSQDIEENNSINSSSIDHLIFRIFLGDAFPLEEEEGGFHPSLIDQVTFRFIFVENEEAEDLESINGIENTNNSINNENHTLTIDSFIQEHILETTNDDNLVLGLAMIMLQKFTQKTHQENIFDSEDEENTRNRDYEIPTKIGNSETDSNNSAVFVNTNKSEQKHEITQNIYQITEKVCPKNNIMDENPQKIENQKDADIKTNISALKDKLNDYKAYHKSSKKDILEEQKKVIDQSRWKKSEVKRKIDVVTESNNNDYFISSENIFDHNSVAGIRNVISFTYKFWLVIIASIFLSMIGPIFF
ncbi:hypothetical protein EDEG_02970 [Edhazardia aedis USNM 41457]|uniref:Uncharacterized protein n=1 Tax=Edhazardia aedis (strain USNM 41457) TaxID=1003232 RepID=J8ZSK8_EDHAE|nr:hypothetical protein EDEG_02970 [Edhazardia aedis USNM 41457]|eukprot:EJW02633.1 hypothetical protein EDEG_02970 [Edhazardia aedis USNM 41457]